MLKSNAKVLILFTLLFIISNTALAQSYIKSTGIGFRGSFYNSGEETAGVYVNNNIHHTATSTGNAGGYIFVYSRFTNTTLFEFTIGNIAGVENVSSFIGSQKVEVFNMTPVLFGLRYEFLQIQKEGFLQPYLSAGFGGYLFSDVKVDQGLIYEDVSVATNIRHGLYLGLGLNIHLGTWIALNFDGKYHFVNVDPNYRQSGSEFGVGFVFSWGDFNKQ